MPHLQTEDWLHCLACLLHINDICASHSQWEPLILCGMHRFHLVPHMFQLTFVLWNNILEQMDNYLTTQDVPCYGNRKIAFVTFVHELLLIWTRSGYQPIEVHNIIIQKTLLYMSSPWKPLISYNQWLHRKHNMPVRTPRTCFPINFMQ
jgi:hypothetical protein